MDATVCALKASLPPELQFVLWADARGRFCTSNGSIGNIADRAYYKGIMDEGKVRAVSDGLISKR